MNRIIFDMDQSECHNNKPCKYIIRYKRAKASNIVNRQKRPCGLWAFFFFLVGRTKLPVSINMIMQFD